MEGSLEHWQPCGETPQGGRGSRFSDSTRKGGFGLVDKTKTGAGSMMHGNAFTRREKLPWRWQHAENWANIKQILNNLQPCNRNASNPRSGIHPFSWAWLREYNEHFKRQWMVDDNLTSATLEIPTPSLICSFISKHGSEKCGDHLL